MKKWELLHLILDNSKSDKGQGDYQDQKEKKRSRKGEFKLSNVNFVQKGAMRVVQFLKCLQSLHGV